MTTKEDAEDEEASDADACADADADGGATPVAARTAASQAERAVGQP